MSWLEDAIRGVQNSTLSILAQNMVTVLSVHANEEIDPRDLLDALVAALLTVTVPAPDNLRSALRPVVERYADLIKTPWVMVADAIIGSLEWSILDKAKI